MKKKYVIGATVGVVLCLSAIIILFIRINSSASKEKRSTVSTERDMNGETSGSGVNKDKEEIKVDTDIESITVLVNKEYKVAKNYVPKDLVVPNIKFSFNYEDEKKYLRSEAAKKLEQLFAAAGKQGYELLGVSGYRSYKRQKTIYDANLLKYGYDYTWLYSAMPGTSEHQTGLAIDISCASMNGILSSKFAETDESKWIQNNAYKYGFVIRYPSKKSNVTGYGYEPWHIRYVGTELAKVLYDRKITLDEYYGYKMNIDLIERETYVYYDILLTQNSKGDIQFSQAILDDILDNKEVEDKDDLTSEDIELPVDPEDIIEGLDTPKPNPIQSKAPQETSTPQEENTPAPTKEPEVTLQPTRGPETIEPTSRPEPTPPTGNNGNNNNNGNNRPDDGDEEDDD